MAYQFKAHVILTGKIICESGLHIGGSEEGYEIGGMDNPILKDKITGFPYIPGSSLKGKMRSAMEWVHGKVGEEKIDGQKVREIGGVHVCIDPKCPVCRIFGTSADRRGDNKNAGGPTRLLVRDAHLAQETLQDPSYVTGEEKETADGRKEWRGTFHTENKTENSLNRITSAANPRPMERVPKGAKFTFEMLYGIYDIERDSGKTDIENLKEFSMALQMLEAGVLGGGGSRGSGKIKLTELAATIKRLSDYQELAEKGTFQETVISGETVSDVLAQVKKNLLGAQ